MTRAFIVIGLANGDEGKGSWVDHLVRKHEVRHVLRFNGGAQARHHVVTRDGKMHGFSQFCSGTMVPGTKTLLSRFMLVDPFILQFEANDLQKLGVHNPLQNIVISENAPVITPFNRILNQVMEIFRGKARHGSCGYGIGLTQSDVETLKEDAFYVRDIKSSEALDKLRYLWNLKLLATAAYENQDTAELIAALRGYDLDQYLAVIRRLADAFKVVSEEQFISLIAENDTVFEGAQGLLLDQKHGTFPHCTRSNCTFENALTLLSEAGVGEVEKIGLLRAYMTRHGAGPFITEVNNFNVDPCHNSENLWQGKFRSGWFDAVAARYAIESVGGVDTLAITNLDRMLRLPQVRICTDYREFDKRYYDNGRILPLNGDLSVIAQRTAAMDHVVPEYQDLKGWHTCEDASLRNYLNTIEYFVGNAIGAYSDSILHHKIYR